MSFGPVTSVASARLCRSLVSVLTAALLLAAPTDLLAQTSSTTTTITSSGTAGSYVLAGSVFSTATTVGGPTGKITFTDQSNNYTLGSASLSTPTGTAAGLFTSTATAAFSGPGSCTQSLGQILATDANGDGKLDLVIADTLICPPSGNSGGTTLANVLIAQGNGDGTFQAPTVFAAPSASTSSTGTGMATGIASGNFGSTNGQPGYVLVSTGTSGQIAIMQDSLGHFSSTVIGLPTATGAVIVSPDSTWVAVGTTSGVNLYSNNAGALTLTKTISISGGASVLTRTQSGLVAGSCPSATTGLVSFVTGTTAANLQTSSILNVNGCIGGIGNGLFRSTDTDEILVSSQPSTGNSQLELFDQINSSGAWGPEISFAGPFANATSITATNLDGDPFLDFVITDNTSSKVSLYFGKGNGTFLGPTNITTPASPAYVTAGSFTPTTSGFAVTAANGTYEVFQSTVAGTTALAVMNNISIPGTGNHTIIATYSGDTNFAPSTSNSLNLAATPIATTLSLAASPASSLVGQSVTLTATLAPYSQNSLTSDGDTMTFKSGTQVIGTANLTSGAAKLTTSALPVGTYAVTASFPGDSNFAASQSTAVTVTVSAPPTPQATLSPTSLTFSGVNLGTNSSTQTVTLSNPGASPLSISSVGVSGDFAQTNTCGSSVAAGATCTISVTFTPTASGTRTGTLSVNDNAAGSPQTVTLTGTGEGVGLTALATTLSVPVRGGTTSTQITLAGQGGFSGTVSLTCAVNYLGSGTATLPPTCSLNPASALLSSGSSITSTLTINTTGNLTAQATPPLRTTGIALASLLLLGLVPRRRKLAPRLRGITWALLLLATFGGILGCGGSSSASNNSSTSQTTTGNYNVVVTATSGLVTASTTVPLQVQ